ncbi:MAG: biosynthetic peptidoglycan transglycosylase, partial [Myxococcota bacterium]|nr:biosynthetic peptidoglycan transglycosylase [Myxococcota bacterium]
AGDAVVVAAEEVDAAFRVRDGRLLISRATLEGPVLRWERPDGHGIGDAPAWRVAAALRRLVRAARDDADAAGAAETGGGPGGCPLPIEGAFRIARGKVAIADGAVSGGRPIEFDIDAQLELDDCGRRFRLAATGPARPNPQSAIRNPQWAGWRLEVTADPAGLGGTLALPAAAVERLRSLLPGRSGEWLPGGPALVRIAGMQGGGAVSLSGSTELTGSRITAGSWTARAGPGEAAWRLSVGPVEEGRIGLSGDLSLPAVEVETTAGTLRLARAVVRVGSGSHDPATGTIGLAAVVETVTERSLVVRGDPALAIRDPTVRADVTLRPEPGGRVGAEGLLLLEGLTATRADGTENRIPVSVTLDAGTWLDPGVPAAHVRGRVAADGIETDPLRLPLLRLGSPGIGLDVEVRRGDGSGEWVAEGTVSVGGLTVDSRRMAREPIVNVAFDASGRFVGDIDRAELSFERGRVRVGAVEVGASAHAAYRSGSPAFRVALAGAHIRCQDLLDAIPPVMRTDLPGLEFAGTADFQVALDIDLGDLDSTVFDLHADSRCRVVAADERIHMRRLGGAFRREVVLPGGRRRTIVTGPGSPEWTPVEEISRYMIAAVVATEDARFFEHSGVSIADLRAAIVRDLREGRFAYGGSTIDMQVVKNVFLHREKTLARKLQEIILTWWMTQALGKQRIMELYLNVIEYGPGIHGIRHAAMRFFGRTPADLSPLEAAYLAKLLPSPVPRYGMYLAGSVPRSWRTRLDRVLGAMWRRGDIDEAEYRAALVDEVRFHRPGEPLPPPRYAQAGIAEEPWTPEVEDLPEAGAGDEGCIPSTGETPGEPPDAAGRGGGAPQHVGAAPVRGMHPSRPVP